jgi:uncharacterized membrane protein YiaA
MKLKTFLQIMVVVLLGIGWYNLVFTDIVKCPLGFAFEIVVFGLSLFLNIIQVRLKN